MKTEPKSYKDFVSDLRTDIEDPFTNTPVQDQPETGLVGHTLHSEPLDTYMRHRKVKYQLGEAMHPAFGTPNFDRAQKKGPEANPFRKQKTAADIEKIKKAKEADAKRSAQAQGGMYRKKSTSKKSLTKAYSTLLKQIGESSSKLSSQRETSTPVYDAHIKGNSETLITHLLLRNTDRTKQEKLSTVFQKKEILCVNILVSGQVLLM